MATRGLLLALGPAAALGLGRFAYALVLPLMQAAWGLSYAEGGLLGSANTLGYLLGALLSHPLLGRVGLTTAATFIVIHRTPRVDSDSRAGLSLEQPWLRPFTHEARTKPGSLGLGSWAAKAWPT
jgi:MFS family permease